MSLKINRSLFLVASCVVFLASITSCGNKKLNSTGLTMQVLPTQAQLVEGSDSSCLDYTTWKQSILAATPVTLSQSVSAFHISFARFSLTWTLSSTLYVSYIRVTIKSPQIQGGEYSTDISGAELDALLGHLGSKISGSSDIGNSINTSNFTLYSDDPARDCRTTDSKNVLTGATCTPASNTSIYSYYAACGFKVGGIKLANKVPTSFTAPVEIRLVGYSVDPTTFQQSAAYAIITQTMQYTAVP